MVWRAETFFGHHGTFPKYLKMFFVFPVGENVVFEFQTYFLEYFLALGKKVKD